ncbi:hypothetical protein DPMN_183666 [Dreissena polymorpha]|uniref:Uncharacterized protein n=1 Tax=Dreissena polymorpha TaxID=45954 RepID=A0A9D4DIJ2_DREPO|nr:hypothetical protein DPMN_183666 [Dreissena polymorpha]
MLSGCIGTWPTDVSPDGCTGSWERNSDGLFLRVQSTPFVNNSLLRNTAGFAILSSDFC